MKKFAAGVIVTLVCMIGERTPTLQEGSRQWLLRRVQCRSKKDCRIWH